MQTRTTASAVVLVTRLSREIYRQADEDELGMTLKQFSLLNLVCETPGISQGVLAEIMCVDANMVVHLLNGLEERGYAVRERDPDDRRRHVVRATPAGKKALVHAERVLGDLTDEVFGGLDADERNTLRDLLAKTLGDGALAAELPTAET